jgi:hypothetical protein
VWLLVAVSQTTSHSPGCRDYSTFAGLHRLIALGANLELPFVEQRFRRFYLSLTEPGRTEIDRAAEAGCVARVVEDDAIAFTVSDPQTAPITSFKPGNCSPSHPLSPPQPI